ncbi:hypothetical protein MRB53_040907 [Persea americana]|nr:hypothetical protein MRB53_040907 [Persea americana]
MRAFVPKQPSSQPESAPISASQLLLHLLVLLSVHAKFIEDCWTTTDACCRKEIKRQIKGLSESGIRAWESDRTEVVPGVDGELSDMEFDCVQINKVSPKPKDNTPKQYSMRCPATRSLTPDILVGKSYRAPTTRQSFSIVVHRKKGICRYSTVPLCNDCAEYLYMKAALDDLYTEYKYIDGTVRHPDATQFEEYEQFLTNWFHWLDQKSIGAASVSTNDSGDDELVIQTDLTTTKDDTLSGAASSSRTDVKNKGKAQRSKSSRFAGRHRFKVPAIGQSQYRCAETSAHVAYVRESVVLETYLDTQR